MLAIVAAAEQLVRAMVDGLLHEVDRAIDKDEISALRMPGFEAPGDIVISHRLRRPDQVLATPAPILFTDRIIDGNDRRKDLRAVHAVPGENQLVGVFSIGLPRPC